MKLLALILDGPPSMKDFEYQLEVCVYVPLLVVVLSWALIAWKRKSAYAALALAAGAAVWLNKETSVSLNGASV